MAKCFLHLLSLVYQLFKSIAIIHIWNKASYENKFNNEHRHLSFFLPHLVLLVICVRFSCFFIINRLFSYLMLSSTRTYNDVIVVVLVLSLSLFFKQAYFCHVRIAFIGTKLLKKYTYICISIWLYQLFFFGIWTTTNKIELEI